MHFSSLYFLVLLLVCCVSGHTCFLFRNAAEQSLEAIGCAGTAFPPPSGITGWIGPVKTCFTVDCGNCSCVLRASDNSDPIDVNAYQIEKEQAELKSLGKLGGDPVPCCVYSDPNNYYTKPLDTEAVNPEGPSPFCEDTLYGLQKIGSWYVTSLYNMCYFQPHYAVSQ